MSPALTLTGVIAGLLLIAVPLAQFTVDTIFRLAGI
jgi:hypothetical protein